jgi:hypothetical protein
MLPCRGKQDAVREVRSSLLSPWHPSGAIYVSVYTADPANLCTALPTCLQLPASMQTSYYLTP